MESTSAIAWDQVGEQTNEHSRERATQAVKCMKDAREGASEQIIQYPEHHLYPKRDESIN